MQKLCTVSRGEMLPAGSAGTSDIQCAAPAKPATTTSSDDGDDGGGDPDPEPESYDRFSGQQAGGRHE